MSEVDLLREWDADGPLWVKLAGLFVQVAVIWWWIGRRRR